ncbi:hypothetical protein JCM11641_005905 [Rhodosporidiobolus odoratus]
MTDSSPVYTINQSISDSSAPPIPLASLWAQSYSPTPSEPLLNLAQGVPGAPPPPQFLHKLAEAAGDPATTGYGDLRGDSGLRRELARDVVTVYGVKEGAQGVDSENEVAITAGCNLAFYATLLALCPPKSSVILPTPWYFNHQMTISQLSLSLIPLRCQPPSFLPSPSDCATLLSDNPNVRAIILVSPNNPTGAVYPPELLKAFAELAVERGVALVLDETYREFVVGRPHGLFAETEWRRYLVHLFSFSKSYAIPGHRLGALLTSPPLLSQIRKLLDCLQICPARPAQRAVEWAVENTREWREGVREELARRQRVFGGLVEGVEGWRVETGGGSNTLSPPSLPKSSRAVSLNMSE